MAPGDQVAAGRSARPADPNRRTDVVGVESGFEAHHAANLEVAAKEGADELRLIFDNVEGAVFDPVGKRNRSAHPDPLPLRDGDLVADSLTGDLSHQERR